MIDLKDEDSFGQFVQGNALSMVSVVLWWRMGLRRGDVVTRSLPSLSPIRSYFLHLGVLTASNWNPNTSRRQRNCNSCPPLSPLPRLMQLSRHNLLKWLVSLASLGLKCSKSMVNGRLTMRLACCAFMFLVPPFPPLDVTVMC